MWAIWIPVAAGVIAFAVRERRAKGTYWWEPPSNAIAWRIGGNATLALIAVAFIFDRWAPFIWGVLAAICVPALLTGLFYRRELSEKGLKPRYLQK
jgi:hypothetical protein